MTITFEFGNVYFNNRLVGSIKNNCYISIRSTQGNGLGSHYCYMKKGYPISCEVLEFLQSKGVEGVIIIEQGKKSKAYSCLLKDYLDMPEFQLGEFEPQKCYPLASMKLEA